MTHSGLGANAVGYLDEVSALPSAPARSATALGRALRREPDGSRSPATEQARTRTYRRERRGLKRSNGPKLQPAVPFVAFAHSSSFTGPLLKREDRKNAKKTAAPPVQRKRCACKHRNNKSAKAVPKDFPKRTSSSAAHNETTSIPLSNPVRAVLKEHRLRR